MSKDDAPDLLLGVVLDEKYRIDAPLGRGGMGTVYRAMHLGTGREVALKVLVPELTANEAAVERFKREAKTAGQMRHPNVVDVTDFGFAELGGGRLAYLVMELLQGKTLRALMEAEGRVPLDVAIDVLDQVCAAVNEAHGMGVLHRDIKPENIHLGPGVRGRYRVKVLDFGIAKLLHETAQAPPPAADAATPAVVTSVAAVTMPEMTFGNAPTMPVSQGDGSLTRLGAVIGTPRYMSPEQWLGREIDVRADVYSLGVMAYEMLAGEPPFLGKARSIAIEHAQDAAPPLAEKAPKVPGKIARVIEQAMAKEPAGRPPTAAAFAAGLQAGAETTGKLLRRSIELSADNYVLFSRRCAILSVPLVALPSIAVLIALLARKGLLAQGRALPLAAGMDLFAALSAVFLSAPVTGALVPLVADLLMERPSPRAAPPAAELWRLLRASVPSTLGMFGLMASATLALTAFPSSIVHLTASHQPQSFVLLESTLLWAVSALVACAVFAPLAVYPAVLAIEGARGLAPLRRSVVLLRPMWRSAFGVIVFYTLLTQVMPTLFELIVPIDAGQVSSLRGTLVGLGSQVAILFMCALTAALQPFNAVPLALLYLRAREAEGKPFT